MIDEITYEGETYRRITRNGMYYANADGKVLSLQRGQRRILKVVVIEGRPRIILRIDSRTRQFTPMRIRYAVQQGVYAEDVPNIAYVKDEQGRVTPKEERKLPDTVSFNGTEYARIPGETEYYATREGELLSFRSGKPRILAGFNRGGYRKYDMWPATLGKRSMSRNVIAYSVQKGVPLNELVGKVILQGRGGKLVPWKVKQYQRMAASTLCKKRMENPEKRIRRMKMEIQMFEDYYRTHDILPIKRYVSRMKDVLMGMSSATTDSAVRRPGNT